MSESKTNIRIGDVETFSIVDFPNIISAVVFMQGCPWKCPFCYNTELQKPAKDSNVNWPKFLDFLAKRKGILEGVVFSGGEPLMQPEALLSAIDDVKALGYKVGLHTGGFAPENLFMVAEKLDWVGLDIKAPLNAEAYKKATGRFSDFQKIIDSINVLKNANMHFECRTTCDPRHLNINDIYTIAEELLSLGVEEYYLQKYRPIEGDNTEESECNKFFTNNNLISYLHNTFKIFDIRK